MKALSSILDKYCKKQNTKGECISVWLNTDDKMLNIDLSGKSYSFISDFTFSDLKELAKNSLTFPSILLAL